MRKSSVFSSRLHVWEGSKALHLPLLTQQSNPCVGLSR